jgi:hypothetical protein
MLGENRPMWADCQQVLQMATLVFGQVRGPVMIHDTSRRGGGRPRSAWARPWLR